MLYTGTNATPPAREHSVFNCSEQLRLTVDSGAPSRMARSSTVHCQLELQGTVEDRSLLVGGVAFDILRCWKDDHLQTSEYSMQGKYKGEVTNTMKNVKGIFFTAHCTLNKFHGTYIYTGYQCNTDGIVKPLHRIMLNYIRCTLPIGGCDDCHKLASAYKLTNHHLTPEGEFLNQC